MHRSPEDLLLAEVRTALDQVREAARSESLTWNPERVEFLMDRASVRLTAAIRNHRPGR